MIREADRDTAALIELWQLVEELGELSTRLNKAAEEAVRVLGLPAQLRKGDMDARARDAGNNPPSQ